MVGFDHTTTADTVTDYTVTDVPSNLGKYQIAYAPRGVE